MSIGHHSITIKWKNVYTFGMTKCFKRVQWNIQIMGMNNRWSNLKEDTIHVSRYSLINRQSERDRKCLKKIRRVIIICQSDIIQ